MAAKKVKFLTIQDRDELMQLENISPGIIKYIESTGTIPEEIFKNITGTAENVAKKVSRLKGIAAKLGTREIFQRFISDVSDETGLTVPELKDRLEAFQELSGLGGEKKDDIQGFKNLITEEIMGQIRGQLPGHSMSREQAEKVTNGIADRLFRGEDVPGQEIAERIKDNYLDPSGKIILNDKEFKRLKGYVVDRIRQVGLGKNFKFKNIEQPFTDFSPDISRLTKFIQDIGEKEKAERQIEDFLTSAPVEARAGRERFIQSQMAQGQDYLRDVAAPSIIEELSRRSPGLLRGGKISGLLGEESALVAERIQELSLQLGEDDFNFFANASYQNTIRKLSESTETVKSELDFERKNIRIGQERKFVSMQNQLNRDLKMDLFKRQAERNLNFLQAQAENKRRQFEQQEQQNLIGTGAQAAGQVGTAFFLKKFG